MDLFLTGYLGLFLSAFLAATLLPFYSELALVAMAQSERFDPALLWLVATAGNTLGAAVNWALGRYLLHFQERKWFPFSSKQMEKATKWFNRWGLWSLLFAWLPWGGDPLTFVAGVLRVRFGVFLILVGVGKALRYVVVLAAAAALT
jgi:membrane protein YqaA with SNARE-associated domain